MKQLFIAVLIAVSITSTAFAGTILNNNTCQDITCVVENYKNVIIENKTDFTKASINEKDIQQEIFYSPEGDFIGTSKNIGYDKLPTRAIKTISKVFLAPEYTVKNCIQFVNADNATNYYVSLDTKTQRTILEINEFGNVTIFDKTNI